MQNTGTTPAPTIDIELAYENPGADLDFIQNVQTSGSALGTFTPHLIIFVLLLGALLRYL